MRLLGLLLMGAPLGCSGGASPTSLPLLPDLGPRDADCQIDATALSLVLASAQPGGAVVSASREPGRVVESVVLADGVAARVVQGGCNHYGLSFTFGLRRAPADPRRAAAARVVSLVAEDGGAPDFLRWLQSPQAVASPEGFDCGEGWCSVEVEPHGQGVALTASYSFAL
jgi:hypothetical protein